MFYFTLYFLIVPALWVCLIWLFRPKGGYIRSFKKFFKEMNSSWKALGEMWRGEGEGEGQPFTVLYPFPRKDEKEEDK